jgi:hypothetical protein
MMTEGWLAIQDAMRKIHVCHMRRRIHACHMRRRINACGWLAMQDAMRRRICACHMRRSIHAVNMPINCVVNCVVNTQHCVENMAIKAMEDASIGPGGSGGQIEKIFLRTHR